MPTFKQLWNGFWHHQPIDPQTDHIIEMLGNLPLTLAILAIVGFGLMVWFTLADWCKRIPRWRTWEEAMKEQEAKRK